MRNMRNRGRAVALALLCAGTLASAAQAGGTAPPLEVHGSSELPALLGTLARGRPLVLHFCATWCDACRAELKKLQPRFAKLDARGVSLVLVWIDEEKSRPAIPKLIAKLRLGGLRSIVLDAPEPAPVAKALGEPAWGGALPATFVYDVHQVKLSSFLGRADEGLLDDAIDEALRRAAVPAAK